MKARYALLLVATLALIGALSACTANGGDIYATIETEKKIYVSTLDETLTVLDMVNVGSGALPYFVAAGAVYNGRVPDLNNVVGWPNAGGNPIPAPPPVRGALCTALTYFPNNGRLYGAFFDESVMGVYTSTTASPSFTTAIAALAGKQITLLQADATNLYAVVATPTPGGSSFTYELDSSTDGSAFTATNLTGLADQITGVGFFNSTYFVTSGPKLYSGAALNLLTASSSIGGFSIDSGDELLGVTVDNAAGYILIPSRDGAVYYSTNGTTWAKASTSDQINGHSIGFLTVSTLVGNAGPGPVFLVGADGAGFYTLNAATANLARYSDVTVTGLYAGAVRRMLVDPTQSNLVFMGTAGTGLWRATFDPATGAVNSSWIHE